MQLASKMRFVAAQFMALLADDLWLRNAEHANAMARRLADGAGAVPGVVLTYPVQANGVFARLPRSVIEALQAAISRSTSGTRRPASCGWMTSFDTTPADVDGFVSGIADAVAQHA